MKNLIRNNWASLLLITMALAWGYSQQIPESMPVHFDLNGNADRYSSGSFALLFMPLMSLAVILLISLLLKYSPQNFAASQSSSGISKLLFTITAFLMIIHFGMIKEAQEPHQWMQKVMPMALSLLSILMGNYLGKIEKNFVIGIRLPWTLASEENWKRTHRFAGKCYVAVGILNLVLSFFFPNLVLPVAGLIACSLAGAIYSFYYYRTVELRKISM